MASAKTRRRRRPRTSVPASTAAAPTTAGPSDAGPGDAITLNTPATWLAFGCLLLAGVLLAFAKWLVLIIVGGVVFFRALFWLCERFPRTMFVITALLRGLFSRR
jgi:hypothetical protein